MKKYIQPTDRIINLEAEGTIAASEFNINREAAQSDALTNKKETNMWGDEGIWK